MGRIKTECRSHLEDTLKDLLQIKLEGPRLQDFSSDNEVNALSFSRHPNTKPCGQR